MLLVDVLIIFLFQCASADKNNGKRLILHSPDDIALEFQKLRQDIDALTINQTNEIQALKSIQAQEIETLKINYTHEIQALKSIQAQEIETLKINYTHEIQALKSTQAQEIEALKINQTNEIQALKTTQAQELDTLKKDQGSVYVRWGRTTCDGNGTEKVYSGFTSGSPFNVGGGAASYVCLPQHPTWAKYVDGIQDIGGYISGTEYQLYVNILSPFPQNMHDQDAPCVLCRSARPTTVMIPGRTDCYPGWTIEYTGYLMTGHTSESAASDYACVDVNPEAVYHGEANLNGKLLYMTEVKCGSLPCQEYPDGRELACVVCSK